jgi:hypothetical protein
MADLAHARTVSDGVGQKPDTDSIKKGVEKSTPTLKSTSRRVKASPSLDQAEVFLQ